MSSQVREVISKQVSVHDDLLSLVNKHKVNDFKRPIAEHTQQAFDQAMSWLGDWQGNVILDACCGVGESTLNIAKNNPNARVIGVDKSAQRLDKHQYYAKKNEKGAATANNYLILQADLNDFWRLLAQMLNDSDKSIKWRLLKQYILYPNPYPKKSQVGKRWHASAVFPSIIACCKNIELRSNWQIYVQEFVNAAEQYGVDMKLSSIAQDEAYSPITPFERKYSDAGQALWMASTFSAGCDK
jgi:tRNA G46 methylase TrmB